ncbi:MAG: peptide chain release factor N(5)-glutamine methyltransferase [Phycisphaeraceae bacterium]|nr:peptide chain release factor N(5)-glutamine methyltransferase [Phycisphaeraceae bacterium]
MTQPAPTSNEPWTTRRLLAWMGEAFGKAGLESPRLQAEMLLAHVIGCQRLRLFMEAEREATSEERDRLRGLVARALRHEPIDYLVGERSFFGLLMKADARVLVPRPSTETLVEFVLQASRRAGESAEDAEGAEAARSEELVQESEPRAARIAGAGEVVFDLHDREGMSSLGAFKPSGEELEEEDEAALERAPVKRTPAAAPPTQAASPGHRTPVNRRAKAGGPAWRIADVCTGSGCIAIAIAKHLARARVVATDISGDALAVARDNAARHGVDGRIEFVRGDLLAALRGKGPFDVIVSNPPYIPDDEWADVPANVKDYEPTIALRGGTDGLDFVRPLLADGAALLAPGGLLLVEVAASRAEEAAGLARANPMLEGVEVLRDCDALPRVVVARRRGGE